MLSALTAGRAAAERLMTDRCVVRRPTGSTTNPVTFEATPTFTVVYDPDTAPHRGKFKVAAYEAFEQEPESAGVTARISRVRCDFPAGAAAFLPGDVVSVTDSRDPLLVGRHFRLTVPAPYKAHATAYRVFAEELVGVEVPSWLT